MGNERNLNHLRPKREVYWLGCLHCGKGRGEAGLGQSQILHLSIAPPLPPPSTLLPFFPLSLSFPLSPPVSLAPNLLLSVSPSIFPLACQHVPWPHPPHSEGTSFQKPCPPTPMALTAERKGVFSSRLILILKDTERLGLGYMPIFVMGEIVTRAAWPESDVPVIWSKRTEGAQREGETFLKKRWKNNICISCKCLQSIRMFVRSVLTFSPGRDFFFLLQLYCGIIEAHYTWCVKMYSLISFDICIHPWSHHCNQGNKRFPHHKIFSCFSFFIPLYSPYSDSHRPACYHYRLVSLF